MAAIPVLLALSFSVILAAIPILLALTFSVILADIPVTVIFSLPPPFRFGAESDDMLSPPRAHCTVSQRTSGGVAD
ncbi:unnamed protein product [Boreogadus saida]